MNNYKIKEVFNSEFDLFYKSIDGKLLFKLYFGLSLLFLLIMVTGIRSFNKEATIDLITLFVAFEFFITLLYFLFKFSKIKKIWRGNLEVTTNDSSLDLSFNLKKIQIKIDSIEKLIIKSKRLLTIKYHPGEASKELNLPFNDNPVLIEYLGGIISKSPRLKESVYEQNFRGKLIKK